MIKIAKKTNPLFSYPLLIYLDLGEAKEIFVKQGFYSLLQEIEALPEKAKQKQLEEQQYKEKVAEDYPDSRLYHFEHKELDELERLLAEEDLDEQTLIL